MVVHACNPSSGEAEAGGLLWVKQHQREPTTATAAAHGLSSNPASCMHLLGFYKT